MKKELAVGMIVAAAIALSAISATIVVKRGTTPGHENVPAPGVENVQDILLTTIATEKGVAKENLMICFFEQTENDNIFAVGVVSRVGGGLVFFYDTASHEITHREVDNTTATDEEFLAFSVATNTITPWAGGHIVPCDFNKQDNNTYTFGFYDNYYAYLSRWSWGYATVYLENETIEWGPSILE